MIHIVLLSGGSGTRLWPLSNSSRSKQFLKVLRDENGNHVSMVQRVFGQIEKVPIDKDVTIATSENQRDAIISQVPEGSALVFEPERRDTAPADHACLRESKARAGGKRYRYCHRNAYRHLCRPGLLRFDLCT